MKFMIEFNPPVEAKNSMEKILSFKRKLVKTIERMKPVAGWFTWRRGFFDVDVNSYQELNVKIAAFFYLLKMDPVISPAFGLEDFGNMIAGLGEEAKKYEY
jgi:hypothetical protein